MFLVHLHFLFPIGFVQSSCFILARLVIKYIFPLIQNAKNMKLFPLNVIELGNLSFHLISCCDPVRSSSCLGSLSHLKKILIAYHRFPKSKKYAILF